MKCSLCKNDNEDKSEIHLLKCTEIRKELTQDLHIANVSYSDIFSENIEDQVAITKIFDKILKLKNIHQNS